MLVCLNGSVCVLKFRPPGARSIARGGREGGENVGSKLPIGPPFARAFERATAFRLRTMHDIQ